MKRTKMTVCSLTAILSLLGAAGRVEAQALNTRFTVIFLPSNPNQPPEDQVLGFSSTQISSSSVIPCPGQAQISPAEQAALDRAAAAQKAAVAKAAAKGVGAARVPKYELTDLRRLLECAAGDSTLFKGLRADEKNLIAATLDSRIEAIKEALAVATAYRDASSMRAFAERGDAIMLVAFVNATLQSVGATKIVVEGPRSEFTFNETARESRFAADLQTLGSVAFGLARGAAVVPDGEVEESPVVWMEASLRLQTETRSDIKVSHKLGAVGQFTSPFDADALARWRIRRTEAAAMAMEDAAACDQILQPVPPPGPVEPSPADLAKRQDPVAIAACQLSTSSTPETIKSAAAEALSHRPSAVTTTLLRRALRAASSDALKAALTKALGAADGVSAPRTVPGGGSDAGAARVTTVTSGGREHWFLSADVMLSDDLKIGQAQTGELVVSEKPPSFYVGANFVLGDLLTSDRPVWQNIILKAFVKGTSRPQESVGLGIGLRGKYFDWPALNFETISPYLAMTWTRTEAGQRLGDRKAVGRVGVSVNLDKAIDWVK